MNSVAEFILFGGKSNLELRSDFWIIQYSSCLACINQLSAQCLNHTWYATANSYVNSGYFDIITDSIVIDNYIQISTAILSIDITSIRSGIINATSANINGTVIINIETPQKGYLPIINGNVTGGFSVINISYPFTTKCTSMESQITSQGFGILFSDSCTANSDIWYIATASAVGGAIIIVAIIISVVLIYMRTTRNSWVYFRDRSTTRRKGTSGDFELQTTATPPPSL